MSQENGIVAQGALASYGVSYYAIGRLSANYVHRVLTGTSPRNLPVESVDRFELVVNLKTAKALGLTIPHSVLVRADQGYSMSIEDFRFGIGERGAASPRTVGLITLALSLLWRPRDCEHRPASAPVSLILSRLLW